ncbi:UNVERIFIED_CONTAM: Programmed cell death protein 2-like [Sesamum calycinum]|uniref:Programmed cell death protein 2-like n=1 Tax=Sesamum calycinum TaxID=2727403 RepID=A0AAW2SAY4_9LAMI
MDIDLSGEKLKSLHISSLDDVEDDEEVQNDDVEDEVSDEDDEEEDQVPMTLGFVEKPKNPWTLLRQYFPSKAGGTPAWLDPINLPSEKSSLCDFCGEPLQFLLQVYAPLPEESTFHRTLFIFMCPSMTCLLRDQHEQWKRHPETPSKAKLCNWCGTWKGDKICSSCRRARYCSGKHQTGHWRSGNSSHKVFCRQMDTSGKESESAYWQTAASNSLWPEYEITNEDEGEPDEEMTNDDGSASSLISRSRMDGSFGKLQTYFKGNGENRSWASFQERISLAPDQVLRYSSSAEAKPLWPVSSGRPSKLDIPKCNSCGGTRGFEFQVLPQLLYFFHVKDSEDSLDWATIVVYTCEASCEGGVGYKEEFAWVQLASQSISHR